MRYGPLTATADGVAVGPAEGVHLLVAQEGALHRRGSTPLADIMPWEGIARIELGFPASWFPYPGSLATVGYALLALVSQQADEVRYGESTLAVTSVDGDRRELTVNHAIGGYGTRALAQAALLLDRLIAEPGQRASLTQPEQLVQRYADAVRRRPRSASE